MLQIERTIELDLNYYRFADEQGGRAPALGFLDERVDQEEILRTSVYLFDDDGVLKSSVLALESGKPKAAISLLRSELDEARAEDREYKEKAQLYNNLGAALLFDAQVRDAKEAFNQAGLFWPSSRKIRDNIRTCTFFLQNEIYVII